MTLQEHVCRRILNYNFRTGELGPDQMFIKFAFWLNCYSRKYPALLTQPSAQTIIQWAYLTNYPVDSYWTIEWVKEKIMLTMEFPEAMNNDN